MTTPHLSAGPALDAEVATKVMGWTLMNPDHLHPLLGWWKIPAAGTDKHFSRSATSDQWSPSQSIAHAWEVVRRMRQLHGVWEMADELSGERGEGLPVWGVTLLIQGQGQYHAQAATEPEAICLAALAAVGAAPPLP